ncbi:MAG: CdaR family protein [Balneolaceae bacterium]|nr:CdaR family protein [Balneolaceae bacterium]
MNGFDLGHITDRFWTFWNNFLKRADEEGVRGYSKEKIFVFIIALILALCLWFLVNLSRTYVLNINLPIELGNIPEERALAENLPGFATVSVQAEGWKLINLYNNPPRVFVDVSNGEVNLYDQVQQQMNAVPDVEVQKVQPLILSLELEERVSKRVPVRSKVNVEFAEQYNFVGTPVINPDSILVRGAASLVEEVTFWETDSVTLRNVREDITSSVPLKEPPNLLTLSRNEIEVTADVAEYTEGESKVFVRMRNMPEAQNVNLSPSFVTVKYSVPIEEYTEVQDLNPFSAYVPWSEVQQDSSGFISPQIEVNADQYHIRIQSHQPEEVAYFNVVEE